MTRSSACAQAPCEGHKQQDDTSGKPELRSQRAIQRSASRQTRQIFRANTDRLVFRAREREELRGGAPSPALCGGASASQKQRKE